MIVKNEEDCLERCLKSVHDYVDEIIIVDTGSTDQTVAIAQKYGAKIYDHTWENDFSKHRNQSLSYATGDWIFQLDADDELGHPSKALLRETIRTASVDAFNIGIIDFTNEGTSSSFHRFPRLFRNNGVIHYEGIVHNQVVGYRDLKNSKVTILHHGYNVDIATGLKRFQRSAPLLLSQIRENPTNPIPYVYLSTSFMAVNRHSEAFDASRRAIALMEKQNLYPSLGTVAYYNLALCNLYLQDFTQMVAIGIDCQKHYPGDIDSCIILVFGYRGLGKWEEVIQWGKLYLSKIIKLDEVGSQVVISLAEAWKTHLFMGEAYLNRMAQKEAVRHFREALSFPVTKEICLNAVIRIMTGRGYIDEALPFVDLAVKDGICHEAVSAYQNSNVHQAGAAGEQACGNQAPEIKSDGGNIRPLISLCMIVKNESDCLKRCLESVRAIAGEMVIVDTGSTDDTVEIAKQLGAEVYTFQWNDDFSAARNFALSKVHGEWTLIMDADEIVAEQDLSKIQALVQSGQADAYRLVLRNYVDDMGFANALPNPNDYREGAGYPGFIPARLIRLFRTCPDIRFTGSVHETLDASFTNNGNKVLDSGIPIHHFGKVMTARIENKKVFYKKLGVSKMMENPQDPVAYKTLADQYLELSMAGQALEVAEKGLSLFPDFAELHFDKGLALEKLGRLAEAERVYRETLKWDDHHVGAYNNLAGILLRRKEHCEALSVLQTASVKCTSHPVIHYTTGLVHSALENHDEALDHFEKVRELSPGFKKVNNQKALVYLKKGDMDRAISCLEQEIDNNGDIVPALITLGEISLRRKDFSKAIHYFQGALITDPANVIAGNYLKSITNGGNSS